MNNKTGYSNNSKNVITILLLIFIYPLGLLFMWFWTKWKLWIKIIVSIPLVAAFATGLLFTVNPQKQIKRAECAKQCQTTDVNNSCMQGCLNNEIQSENTEFTKQDSSEILATINEMRQKEGLQLIVMDTGICSYARWLAIQYKDKGLEYAEQAHKSQITKPETQFTYFNGYKSIYRATIGTAENENKVIGEKFMSTPDSNAFKPDITNGCVYGVLNNDETKWLVVFIGASKK